MAFDILMPLFNKAQFVRESIESLLAQTMGEFVVYVVDDGSTDGSAEIVSSFSDRRIKLARQSRKGVGAARNRAASMGQSPWIAFLDADDLWLPTHLEDLSHMASDFPNALLLASGHSDIGINQATPGTPPQGEPREINYLVEAAKEVGIIHTSATAVKRKAFEQVGGFGPVACGEDIELWARLSLLGPTIFSPKRSAVYRHGTGGIMETESAERPVITRSDLSATVAMLCEKMETLPPTTRRSARLYMNARAASAAWQALAKGDVLEARHMAKFQSGPPFLRDRLIGLGVHLPAGLIHFARRLKSRLKK